VIILEIQYLAICDIGPFRGLHEFNFSPVENKNGFAVFSKNGRGKTTLFNATQWCLFGKVHERTTVIDGKRVTGRQRPIVGEIAEPLMNQNAYESDRNPEMSVTLIAKSNSGNIQVSRTAKSATGTLPRSDKDIKIELVVQFGDETASGSRGQELVEQFFPSELTRFFFMDGESLDEYVNLVKDSQVGGIKNEVEAALRIPGLTRGASDFEIILGELNSKKNKIIRENASANRNQEKANQQKLMLRRSESNLNKKIESRKQQLITLENIENFLSNNEEASNHMAQIRDLKLKKDALETTIIRSSESRVSAAKNAWKSLIWRKAEELHTESNQKIKDAQNAEFQIDSLKRDIKQLKKELSAWTGICGHCNQLLEDSKQHKENMEEKIKQKEISILQLQDTSPLSHNELTIVIGDLSKLSPPHGTDNQIKKTNDDWIEDRKTIQNLVERITKLESNKLQGIDESIINDKWKEKGQLVTSIRSLDSSIIEQENNIKAMESEINALSIGQNSGNDEIFNKIEIVNMMINTIDSTIEKFIESARKEVEERASDAFVKIINAPDALTGVIVDKNFRAKIKGADGKPIRAPSSGQEVTMTLCVLDALRQTSGIRAPIFFDTPARALDEDHKQAQLEYFWKIRDQQFIIFPHSGEYKIEETIENFGAQISRAWELVWPADYTDCPECRTPDPIKISKIMNCSSPDCDHSWDLTSKDTIARELIF